MRAQAATWVIAKGSFKLDIGAGGRLQGRTGVTSGQAESMSEGTRSLYGREKGRVEGCKARDTLRRAPARQRTWIIKNNKNTIS